MTVYLVQPSAPPGSARWRDDTLAALRADAMDARAAETPQAVVDATGPDAGPMVVVLGPHMETPLPVARWLASRIDGARFVFVLDAARAAEFRQQASYGAPPGGRWISVVAGAPDMVDRIRNELQRAGQDDRLRSTLERMRLQMPEPRLPDAAEYQRLVASDRYLASVLRHAHDAIVSVNHAGNVVSWNKGAELLFGLTLVQAQRQPLPALFCDQAAAGEAMAVAMTGSFRMAGLELERAGVVRHVDANFGPLHEDGQRVVGAVVILRDITERHRAEEERQASSRQKDEFLAMLAHELRNPLAPIRNATQVLSMLNQDEPQSQRATEIIARQTDHMAGLIEDLLDVARVTRGTIALDRHVIPLADVVTDAIEQARGLIETRGHRLTHQTLTEGLHVLGDRKRLTQVLANLLVNAAKYTPEGGDIGLTLSGDDHEVTITVSDSGMGMDPELRDRVFDLFVQAERTPDRAAGGLGIGLALVRSLVAMHGGAVAAHSAGIGRGSRFEVRLPRAWPTRSPASIDPRNGAGSIQPLKLMVVDDSEDAAHSLGVLLQASGHQVDVEIDPRMALARASGELPDVFILDIGMPHIDGYELARRIRAIPTERRPVLIALTGYGHASDRERAKLAGFDHHLVKPLEPGELLELLGRIAVEA
ncbi:hybrid sensor histidine kinase/response regulator [Lysobacter sp. A3-1-A15]|uniref:hybrid sensor histidine kinase/response regulator n=1 Tax=Novilysobacter viscosus TaxID=3098602 RepID=UPI002EDAE521